MMESRSIMIKPAGGCCNLNCSYCFYKDEIKHREQSNASFMSLDIAKMILDKAFLDTKTLNLAFQGGEPLLAGLSWFEDLVDYARQKEYSVNWSLQTNGTLINDDFASFFAENNFLIGVSLDGNRLIHNLNRSNSFSKVIEGIRFLEKNHVNFNILSVVTEDLCDNVDNVWAFFRRNGWSYMQFIAAMPSMDNKPYLSPRSYGRFLIRLHELYEEELRNRRFVSIRLFDNFRSILNGYPPEACDMNGRCSIQYVFEAQGECYPCDFYCLDSYSLGNIDKTDFKGFDRRRLELGFLDEQSMDEECKACPVRGLCNNGCRRTRNEENKFIFCQSYKMLFNL